MARAVLCPSAPIPQSEAALVVDVIRATTTALAFFMAGALEVWFAPDHERALALKKEGFLVAGETGGLKPAGFDLGNSPREALSAPVRGKRVVMSTTNGTRAAHRAQKAAKRVALAALWNLSAARRFGEGFSPLVVVAAGKEGGLGIDDAYVAGGLIAGEAEGDEARLARALWERGPDPFRVLADSEAARALMRVGLFADVAAASEVDKTELVPTLVRVEGPYLVFAV